VNRWLQRLAVFLPWVGSGADGPWTRNSPPISIWPEKAAREDGFSPSRTRLENG
jgi:hypothetical protein